MMSFRKPQKRRLWRLALVIIASFASAYAQEPRRNPAPPAAATTCSANDRFIVISRSGDAPGSEILARVQTASAATTPCAFSEAPSDYRVARTGEAKYVLGLRQNFLILDEGTGPSLRRLAIVDLSARREVWSSQYMPEPTPEVLAYSVRFSKYLRLARKNECRNYRKIVSQGFTPLYVAIGEISLSDLTFKATKRPGCVAGQ